VEFGILGLLGANALLTRPRLSATKKAGKHIWLPAVLLAAAWGAIDEVHQLYVPGRQSDPLGFLADLAGAAAGAWLLIRLAVPRSGSVPEQEMEL
jgi:VanZ family protein